MPCLHLAVATAALRGFTMAGLIYGFGGMALTMAKRPLEPSPCVDRNAVGPGAGQRGPECLLRDLAILEYHSTLRHGCGAVVDRVGFAKADPNRARQCKRLRL